MNHNVNAKIKPFVLSNIVKKYINLENEKKRKIRELKDTTTKCFVNIFFLIRMIFYLNLFSGFIIKSIANY